MNGNHTKIETSTEQALVPYINNTNNNKLQTEVNESAHTHKNSTKRILKNENAQEKKKVAPKKKSMIVPEITEIREYFVSQKYPAIEADKFFNHFTSNGWLVSGKTPMKNWQAASNKWMLNNQAFNTLSKTTHLHANTGKDYSEAL